MGSEMCIRERVDGPLANILIAAALLLLASAVFGDDASPVRELQLEPVDEPRSRIVPVKVYISGGDFPSPLFCFHTGLVAHARTTCT